MTSVDKAGAEFLILQEQAKRSLASVDLTLGSNAVIALSAFVVIYAETGRADILYWLFAALLLTVARYGAQRWMRRKSLDRLDPQRTLSILAAFALASGLLWAPIPLLFGGYSGSRAGFFVFFVMAGATAGAVIQSAASWRIGVAFGGPVILATLIRVLMSADSTGAVLGLDTVFFAAMLARAAFISEESFVASQRTAIEATQLAKSLETANRALAAQARTDPLTGLANRIGFREAADALSRCRRPASVILLDLDEFKAINDTQGHRVGDAVLEAVASRLCAECGTEELAVRQGGDEFIVLMWGNDLERRTRVLAARLLLRFEEPLIFDGQTIAFTGSLGVAMDLGGAESADILLAQADRALYRGKREGRARACFFDAEMKGELDVLRRLDHDLPRALEERQIGLAFQPLVRITTDELFGFEALLRWSHPQLGAVDPPMVVQSALRLNLTGRLIAATATRACEFLQALAAHGVEGVRVSINVSPDEFAVVSPAEILGSVVKSHGVATDRIEIEVTEETLFDRERHAAKIAELKACGFRLAIDDFGSGYSAISNLTSADFDTVKIDRALIDGLATNQKKIQLVGAVIAVARPLGCEVVAEGVETNEDAEALRLLGCNLGQGWLFGRPMDSAAALARFGRPIRQIA